MTPADMYSKCDDLSDVSLNTFVDESDCNFHLMNLFIPAVLESPHIVHLQCEYGIMQVHMQASLKMPVVYQ
jgi:hypothetical protein